MRYIEVGGARLSVIGLGTWQFGSSEWGYGEGYARGIAGNLVKRALDLGINVIDSAELYGWGRSEKIVGEAVAGRRESAFLATKLLPVLPLPAVVRWRARASARRLKTPVIDLYQLHFPNPLVPVGLQMAGIRSVLDSGLVRHAGVSNYSLAGWRSAEAALGRPLLSNQVGFSLLVRAPQYTLLPHAQAEGRVVIAYSPLAQGLLSGRYSGADRPGGRVRRLNPMFSAANLERARVLAAELADVGRPQGASASQVALAWLVRKPNVIAIPGASVAAQVEQNAAAADLQLTDEDDARLEDAADRFWSP